MSNNNFWDEDSVSEYDMIAEDAAQSEAVAEEIADSIVEEMEAEEPDLVEASEEQIEEILEEAAYDLDEKESNVIYNARLRLEQAKLYEMLINHSLFAGVDASPDAVKIVENELKHYIVKRLEVLLGIRKPKVRQPDVEMNIELPFNATEINFLKQLAYKGTHGQSATDTAPVAVQPRPTLNPLVGSTKAAPKPVQQTKPAPQPQPIQQQRPQTQQQVVKRAVKKIKKQASPKQPPEQPLQSQSNEKPKKNVADKPKVSSGGALKERKMTDAEAMALAKADLEAMKNRKPIGKLKGKAKIDAIREVNEKYKRKQINGGAPVPDVKQLEMQYLTREANGRRPEDVINGMVKNILSSSKMKIK